MEAKSLNQGDVRRQHRIAGKRPGPGPGQEGEGCSSVYILGLTRLIFMSLTLFSFLICSVSLIWKTENGR